MSEGELLVALRASGAGFRHVVFTQNRRVMLSVAEGGATLRVNRAFAAAPAGVLAAIARLCSARRTRERAAARAEIQRFIASIPAPDTPPVRRERRSSPGDAAHLDRLREEFQRVNVEFFDGALPLVPLFLSGRMRRRNGHFSAAPMEIVISRRLCTHGAPREAEQTLRHEMIHLWQHVSGASPDHGADFRRMARVLGVHPRATRAVSWRGD